MSTSPDSIRVIGEPDLLTLARVARGTWSGWNRNGHYLPSESGLYNEHDVVSVVLFHQLAQAVPVRDAGLAWQDGGHAVVEACLQLPLDADQVIVLVLDPHALRVTLAVSAEELFNEIHEAVPTPRPWVTFPVGALVREARRGFWKYAKSTSKLMSDGRRQRRPQAERGTEQGPRR